jgi:hypothetical protein
MPEPRSQHGSGVTPVGEYAPGARQMNPGGQSSGVEAIPPEHYEQPKPQTRRVAERQAEAQQPKRKGRPVGSRNRPPPTQEMFDGPPDSA